MAITWCKCGMRAAEGSEACSLCRDYPRDQLDADILAAMRSREDAYGMISALTATQLAQQIRDKAAGGLVPPEHDNT